MSPRRDDIALARLLGIIYTEVFQRTQRNPNKPLGSSTHLIENLVIEDVVKTRLNDDRLFVWGPYSPWIGAEANLGVPPFGRYVTFSGGGANDEIIVTAYSGVNGLFATGGTVELWVKADTNTVSGDRIFTAGGTGYSIRLITGIAGTWKVRFIHNFSGTDGRWTTTSQHIIEDSWVHITITYDASSVSNDPIIYINSASVGITEDFAPVGTRDADTNNKKIGNNTGASAAFSGTIDEVRLWNDIRTPTELADNYLKELIGNESNLQLYFQFNEGKGTTVVNYVSGGNIGTFSGTPTWDEEHIYAARWGEEGEWDQ